MRNDERLRTIYEVMAPYIVRNEHNWRDYLAFASQFHKHSFDNILLVYAQDEDVSILATRKQWAAIGRNLIPHAKGVAVCVYRNAKLTLDYLFDVSQTTAPYLSQHQHLGKRGELMGRTSKNIKLRIPEKPHKIKGFRSGSYRVATTISSLISLAHFVTTYRRI